MYFTEKKNKNKKNSLQRQEEPLQAGDGQGLRQTPGAVPCAETPR